MSVADCKMDLISPVVRKSIIVSDLMKGVNFELSTFVSYYFQIDWQTPILNLIH